MKLPPDTQIARKKLTGYLLVPQARSDKSAFLARAGYSRDNVDQLLGDLYEQLLPLEAVPLEGNKFGQYYEIRGRLLGPNGRALNVRTIWMTERLFAHDKIRYSDSGQTRDGMKLELYKDAVLSRDVPEHRLKRGDLVKLVDHHIAPDGSEGYSVEVFNAVGNTIAVTAVPVTTLEPLRENEILCARVMEAIP